MINAYHAQIRGNSKTGGYTGGFRDITVEIQAGEVIFVLKDA